MLAIVGWLSYTRPQAMVIAGDSGSVIARYGSKVTGVAVTAVFASLFGCGASERDLPNDRVWESAHFRYHTRSGDEEVCEAILNQLEKHFELIHGYLGVAWPQGRKIDYYKYRDKNDFLESGECPSDAGGCAPDTSVYTYYKLLDHELIHAYLAPLGLPPRFFVEGIAVILSCPQPVVELGNINPWQAMVAAAPTDRKAPFAEGPWFVGYLLHRYGAERFITFYDRLDDESASAEQIAAAFESVYGETLESVWTNGVASSHQFRCVHLWNCAGANLELDGSPQSVATACDGSDHSRTFELGTETDVVLSLQTVGYYAPVSCDSELPYAVTGRQYGVMVNASAVPIAPGKYFTRALQLGYGDVGVRGLSGRGFSTDCTKLDPIDLGTAEFAKSMIDFTVPNDGSSWFLKLHVPSDRQLWWPKDATPEVEHCTSCAGTADCLPLDAFPSLDTQGNVLLRFTPAAAASRYVTYTFGLF